MQDAVSHVRAVNAGRPTPGEPTSRNLDLPHAEAGRPSAVRPTRSTDATTVHPTRRGSTAHRGRPAPGWRGRTRGTAGRGPREGFRSRLASRTRGISTGTEPWRVSRGRWTRGWTPCGRRRRHTSSCPTCGLSSAASIVGVSEGGSATGSRPSGRLPFLARRGGRAPLHTSAFGALRRTYRVIAPSDRSRSRGPAIRHARIVEDDARG